MIQRRLKGMGVALITPFNEDGSVDYDSLIKLVEFLLHNVIVFLVLFVTTDQTPTLKN